MTEIVVPTLGESVSSATVSRWLKQAGEAVAADEPLVELETDKVTVEVNAPSAGVIESIAADTGAEVSPGAVLGVIGTGAAGAAKPAAGAGKAKAAAAAAPAPEPTPAPASAAPAQPRVEAPRAPSGPVAVPGAPAPLPAAAKMMAEKGVTAEQIGNGSAKGGRIAKGDVIDFLSRAPAQQQAPAAPAGARAPRALEEGEERVKMTRLRRTIAARLKEAQNTAAMLTTFNEVDMGAAMALRAQYKETFE